MPGSVPQNQIARKRLYDGGFPVVLSSDSSVGPCPGDLLVGEGDDFGVAGAGVDVGDVGVLQVNRVIIPDDFVGTCAIESQSDRESFVIDDGAIEQGGCFVESFGDGYGFVLTFAGGQA